MTGFNQIPDRERYPHALASNEHRGLTAQEPESSPSSPHPEAHLHRNLNNRHIQLIAIGGAIGTGLFLGSGKAIRAAGPSIIVSYLIMVPCFISSSGLWASCSCITSTTRVSKTSQLT